MYRKTVNRDKNHNLIKTRLREHPRVRCVFDTAALGDGYPDLTVVLMTGRVLLVEIKSEESIGGAVKIKRELDVMISLVSDVYSILISPEQVDRILEGV